MFMSDAERAEATADLLLAVAREREFWISGDGRVGESDAAALLGWSPDSLRNARGEGRGPPSYRIGGGGHRVTYRITDIAVWLEGQRED